MIAEALGMCESEAKSSITSTEFIRWLEHFHQKWNEPTLECYYMAQIAFEVHRLPYRIFGGKCNVGVKDFLLKFKTKVQEEKKKVVIDESKLKRTPDGTIIDPEWQARIDRSKGLWSGQIQNAMNNKLILPNAKKKPPDSPPTVTKPMPKKKEK